MYSSGRKNHTIALADGQTININYHFVNLLFVFNFTFRYKYSLVSKADDGSANYKDLSKEEATKLNGGTTPKPPVWERYSFLIFLVIFAGVVIYRLVTS